MLYILVTIILFIAMLIYFKIADRFNIIDKPNERSSHTHLTIRGGGVIFLIAILIAGAMQPAYWLVVTGAMVIGAISFLDDRMTLSSKIRIVFHLVAVTLLLISLNLFTGLSWYIIPILYIIVIGIINAYNFMDGINGITGLYSLVVLGGLQYVNVYHFPFIEPDLIWMPIISCLVFLFFNFRRRAKCFAGDVGSVTIAFWIIFLLLKLINDSGNYSYILFLALYGVDSILTIIHRLMLKQNIFEAHRLHFYQIMANEQKLPHRLISVVYAIIQSLIILAVISTTFSLLVTAVVVLIPLILIYVILKPRLMLN